MFRGFHERFPEIGLAETRTISTLTKDGIEDTFLFLESYCDDPGCDCRRVLVGVYSERERRAGREGLVASLTYGWESEQFYREWASFPLTREDLVELKGPALQRLAPQTGRSEEMLENFRVLLEDPSYELRIRRHYAMFRSSVDGSPIEAGEEPPRLNRTQRRAARRGKGRARTHI